MPIDIPENATENICYPLKLPLFYNHLEDKALAWLSIEQDANGKYHAYGLVNDELYTMLTRYKTYRLASAIKIDGDLTTILSLSIIPAKWVMDKIKTEMSNEINKRFGK